MQSHCDINNLVTSNIEFKDQNVQEMKLDVIEDKSDGNEPQVALIWWPKTKAYAFTHVKLAVDGEVWSCDEGYRFFRTMSDTENRAKTSLKGRGIFRFNFDVTSSEVKSLKEFLNKNRDKEISQTCIGGVCRALKETTSIRIMKFFPTIVAASLSLGKKTGLWAKKVKRIDYVGKDSALKNLCSTKVAVDVVSTLAACAAIVEGLYFGIASAITYSK